MIANLADILMDAQGDSGGVNPDGYVRRTLADVFTQEVSVSLLVYRHVQVTYQRLLIILSSTLGT